MVSLYGGMDNEDQGDLQVMQNKAATVVRLMPSRTDRTFMYGKLGWLTTTSLFPITVSSRVKAKGRRH